MPYVVSPRRRTLRSVALLTSGVLALPALAGCTTPEPGADAKPAPMDIAPAERDQVEDGGTLRWAVDAIPATFNTFQADADAATSRVAAAALPALFTLDGSGRPQLNGDYLESAKIVEREPRQVVLYKLNQQAVWSDGREIGAADFVAQWRALSGKDSAYWTARNAGYDRIQKIERGASDLEVRVTFAKPYADWQSLFTPLYPKEVMGTPDAFNDSARTRLVKTAGPFTLKELDRKAGTVTLVRNPRWWGQRAKLESLVLRAVPRDDRAAALATGRVDLAEIDRSVANRIALAVRDTGSPSPAHGPAAQSSPSGALKAWALAHGSDAKKARAARIAQQRNQAAIDRHTRQQTALRGFVVRKSLEPAYTQLALNGESGPLADERVRRAVARALDRKELAETVLKPLALPAEPVGSHIALAGQRAYADSSGALGTQDTVEARALLADAGWTPEGARETPPDGTEAGAEADTEARPEKPEKKGEEKTQKGTDAGSPAASPVAGIPAVKSPVAGGAQASAPAARGAEASAPAGSGGAGRSPGAAGTARPPAAGSSAGAPAPTPGGAAPVPAPAPASPAARSAAQPPAPGGPSRVPAPGSAADVPSDDGLYIVGDDKPGDTGSGPDDWNILAPARSAGLQSLALRRQADVQGRPADDSADGNGPVAEAQERRPGGVAGAYAPKGTHAPAMNDDRAAGPLGKNGEPLTLRFVLPSGPGSEALRTVGDRIARMLDRIGVRTEITKVEDESYFKDHIASGHYDLALYTWPASAYPATDARPIYAKPEPATDGSLLVEQNYTRVGTDHIDQLFAQAVAELDEDQADELMKRADARIWATAASIPLYQRPQLVAVKRELVNVGAFGFAAPRYQDIGFTKPKPAADHEKDPKGNGAENDDEDGKENDED
ncbi:ABC transporter substrate-binding protein [Streptomyces sp. NPDC000410]|uniref:ABC transporter substrate-binding protein n=1 Tax=Streptomyces sp. NPDC000410 TaxID=3154254 RepID=UPI0033284BB0